MSSHRAGFIVAIAACLLGAGCTSDRAGSTRWQPGDHNDDHVHAGDGVDLHSRHRPDRWIRHDRIVGSGAPVPRGIAQEPGRHGPHGGHLQLPRFGLQQGRTGRLQPASGAGHSAWVCRHHAGRDRPPTRVVPRRSPRPDVGHRSARRARPADVHRPTTHLRGRHLRRVRLLGDPLLHSAIPHRGRRPRQRRGSARVPRARGGA